MILVGISRTSKTPTRIYLATSFGELRQEPVVAAIDERY